MKKLIIAVIAFATVSVAFASCPPYQPYRCVPTIGGKMMCGCGY